MRFPPSSWQSAWFAPSPPTAAVANDVPFTDVVQGEYYYEAVGWAYAHDPQITTGYTGTTLFGTDDPCTREQVVTFLWRAAGCPEPQAAENPFADVDAGAYYGKAVRWAADRGITTGYTGTNRFGVGDTCTRAQIVTFLHRDMSAGEAPYDPDAVYTTEASIGNPNNQGSATVSIEGTATTGNVTIAKGGAERVPETNGIAIVDVGVEGGQLSDSAEIRIKYRNYNGNPQHLDATTLLPGWYNEESGEWETVPYVIDEETNEVVILTNHFTKFGLFEIEGGGTRTAFAKPLSAARLAQLKEETTRAILEPYKNGTPAVDSQDTTSHVLGALDDSFNSGLMFGNNAISTIISRGGEVSSGWMGTMGKQAAVLGLAGACLSVANNAYKKGWTDDATLQAMGNAGITLGVTFASTPIQYAMIAVSGAQMAYNYYDERQQKSTDAQMEALYDKWRSQQKWANWKLADWRREVLDPVYEKYFHNGTAATPYENYESYLKHVRDAIYSYPHQFAVDCSNGTLARMFPNDNVPVPGDAKAMSAAYDVCYNQETALGQSLEAYFRVQSRNAYIEAVNGLEQYCEQVRQELNQEMTINVHEIVNGGNVRTAGCVLQFSGTGDIFAGIRNEWSCDFDDAGNASITMTGAAYAGLGCPTHAYVWSKSTNRIMGAIDLGRDSTLSYGVNDIDFDASGFVSVVNIHEKKVGDAYQFAGKRIRLVPAETGRIVWERRLDDKGSFTWSIDPVNYYATYGDTVRLEVVDDEDRVLKSVPFGLDQSEIVLSPTDLLVNITCADAKTAEHYAGGLVMLAAATEGGQRVEAVPGRLDSHGKGTLGVSLASFNFYGGGGTTGYALYVCDGKYTSRDFAAGLAMPEAREDVTFDATGICNIVLTYDPPEVREEPLMLDEHEVTLIAGESWPISTLAGSVGDVRVDDVTIADATCAGIYAHRIGTTTIHCIDGADGGHEEAILVNVIDPPGGTQGFYRCTKVYEEMRDISDPNNNYVKYYPDDEKPSIHLCEWGVGSNNGPGHIVVVDDHSRRLVSEPGDDPEYEYNLTSFRLRDEGDPLLYAFDGLNLYSENWYIEVNEGAEHPTMGWPTLPSFTLTNVYTAKAGGWCGGNIVQYRLVRYHYALTDLKKWPELDGLSTQQYAAGTLEGGL